MPSCTSKTKKMHECPLVDTSYRTVRFIRQRIFYLFRLCPVIDSPFSLRHHINELQATNFITKHTSQPVKCPALLPCMHCHQHADMTFSDHMLAKGLPVAPVAVRFIFKRMNQLLFLLLISSSFPRNAAHPRPGATHHFALLLWPQAALSRLHADAQDDFIVSEERGRLPRTDHDHHRRRPERRLVVCRCVNGSRNGVQG